MSRALDQLLHSLDHAACNQTKAEIGCGIFDHIELRMAAAEIRSLREREERLEHDQKLLLAALKRYIEEPRTLGTKRAIHAAYHHVSGT